MKVYDLFNPSLTKDFANTELANGSPFEVLIQTLSSGKLRVALKPNEAMSDIFYSFTIPASSLSRVRGKMSLPRYVENLLKSEGCFPTWLWHFNGSVFRCEFKKGTGGKTVSDSGADKFPLI